MRQRDGRRDGQQEPGGERERDELRLARQEARDDPPPGEGVDARRGVGDERVHDGRAVRARPPFEGGRDPILKLVPPIGQARHVARRQLQGQSVHGSDEKSRAQQAARDGEPERTEQLAQHERHEGQDRAREQPAETVELGAPQSDLLSDFRDEPLENDWIGHGHLPVSVRLPQEHLFLLRHSSSAPRR